MLVHELMVIEQLLQRQRNLCHSNINECEMLVENFVQGPSL